MSASFVHDGDGNRVKSIINGVSTDFIGNYYEVTPGAAVRKNRMAGASPGSLPFRLTIAARMPSRLCKRHFQMPITSCASGRPSGSPSLPDPCSGSRRAYSFFHCVSWISDREFRSRVVEDGELMLNLRRSGTSARTSSYGWRIFVLAVCMTQLVACVRHAQYDSVEGVRFISPLGRPPAQTVLWSPHDADRMLVEASGGGNGPDRIYVLDMASGKQRVLADASYGKLSAMGWAPDGKKLTISIEPGSEGYEAGGIWIMNLDSGVKTPLNTHGYLAWSPEGDRMAYLKFIRNTGAGRGGIELHLLDLASMQDEMLYSDNDAPWFFGLSWSPDARSLVFAKGDIDASDVYVFDVDARRLVAITDGGANGFPTWSPAGDVVAYWRLSQDSTGLNSSIHLINSDGTCDTELPELRDVHSPTWSPDGKQLAFIGPDGIYVADLEVLLGRDLSKGLCP